MLLQGNAHCRNLSSSCQRALVANNAGLSDEGSRDEVRRRERHARDAAGEAEPSA